LKHGYYKNELDQIVPNYTIKKSPDNRFALDCVQKIEIIDFENYKITYYNGNRFPDGAPDKVDDMVANMIIYPNPVNDYIKIYLAEDYFSTATLQILDAMGNIVLTEFLPALQKDIIIPVDDLEAGVYILRLYDQELQLNKTFYKN